ncbi:MAG: hypothetical protein A2469_04620 [Candidatus Magasanikbacteria bacterium RIFOXYC2_FULL_40_16]|uniref:Type 4 fimbrial biogenesis protein PilX N-terminal domain-containing protein n=3 Tax=Candidatus Magasanikiibacteriota TaxID=1752731 RepID=A0A1F6NZR5_9BACT|nr:MAG: hypothetical protein A2224_02220 [Candidatus Magasanikbacteria bacterium RIFOXYA2_FULL_40_20]OGH87379.1 MAG: hypothetical protein A2206_00040 [Candidatus Magasanikbacteria bacterium RIFOXYA1_FULL_40_8]OGH89320.1 MAG: hypothetical protein A2469_04620 [Candidatus Magasanikbacteria bacterium RIFOXYC2_FULL_40_16]
MKKFLNNQGYAAIVSVLLATTIGFVIVNSIASILVIREKIVRNILGSAQSYYTAESGLEDMILRMVNPDLSYEWFNTLSLAGATATVGLGQVDDLFIISSSADKDGFVRAVEVNLTPSVEGASFNYGIQTGQGGILMKNDSTIVGNLYSNGDVVGVNSAHATGDVWVVGATGKIDTFDVGGDAHAHTIKDSVIGGDAYYQSISGGSVAGTSYPDSPDPEPVDMPITDEQIDGWKATVASGEEMTGNFTYEDGNTSLGLTKIVGNLTIGGDGNDVFTLAGTIWVTGNLILYNNGVLQLDSAYGDNSGMIIVDGDIDIKNNFIICGSEGYDYDDGCNEPNDSYVMLLSSVDQLDPSDPAIRMQNNAQLRGILYAPHGLLFIENSATLKEATAYQIQAENNCQIIYESGLINLNFSSGPGGGWLIEDWIEVVPD